MNIQQVVGIFFSPTGHARELVERVVSQFDCPKKLHEATSHAVGTLERSFSADELLVVGVPVYGGRVPQLAIQRLQKIQGNQTPAIALVAYGNRGYDDAVLELKNFLKARGFQVIGAAAVVTEHSIVHNIGRFRPDAKDWQEVADFTQQVKEKLAGCDSAEGLPDLYVKGRTPYITFAGYTLKPEGSKECIKCGFCARECPANAISPDKPRKTDATKCISCMRCVTFCPQQARSVSPLKLKMVEWALQKKSNRPKNSEFFL